MEAETDAMAELLRQCETRLVDTGRVLSLLLEAVRDSRRLSPHGVAASSDTILAEPEPDREAALRQILVALGPWSNDAPLPRPASHLLRRGADAAFYIGERGLWLSDTETRILRVLWEARPEAASRDTVFATLYPREDKPRIGVVDVFVSKLRQKLKLASDGGEYIVSVRGKGWALHPGRCQFD